MTIDDLAAEFRSVLVRHAAEGSTDSDCLRRLLGAAREYAAAQVEEHARAKPWPWPPRRPEPHQLEQGAGAQGKREAVS